MDTAKMDDATFNQYMDAIEINASLEDNWTRKAWAGMQYRDLYSMGFRERMDSLFNFTDLLKGNKPVCMDIEKETGLDGLTAVFHR